MQGGKRPTKAQQAWQDWQREQGCANCGASNPSIHHCVGSTAKHNKVEIGQWWTIPLCYECHQGDQGIHKRMGRFVPDWLNRKDHEKNLLNISYVQYATLYGEAPMPDSVYEAIMSYHK